MTQLEFILKAQKVHGNKYNYDEVQYERSDKLVKIICKEHGEFWQLPSAHLRGRGCPLCANLKRGRKRNDNDSFIEKCRKIHGDKYDYSETQYKDSKTKIKIICSQHGVFEQLPYAHLQGQGCPKCQGIGLNQEEYIEKFRNIHGNNYDYSESVITKVKNKIKIICKEHGEFYQTPMKHLQGQGCPKCSKIKAGEKISLNYKDFVIKSNNIHNFKYNYIKESYKNCSSKVDIICPNHGVFSQMVYDHLAGHGCPICGKLKSNNENEIYVFICDLLGENNVIKGDRTVLNGKEIDIYIPSLKIGIEYNGIYWHSDKFIDNKNYHLDKLNESNSKGIKLIQIFEDEYINHKEIVLSKIKHILGYDSVNDKIYGRKCNIKEINKDNAKLFLEVNHIQGFAKSSVYLGCFYQDKLIGVMSFLKENVDKWYLTRFATDNQYICCGVGGKLFNWFIKYYNPKEIKTFADRRWTVDKDNNLYTKLGFKLDKILSPDYKYIKPNIIERYHKFNFRKQILNKKYNFSFNNITEKEMTQHLNYHRIYDCGLWRYVWKN